jgi:hypothetical protein
MFILCLNTRTSMIKTNAFFDFTDFQVSATTRRIHARANSVGLVTAAQKRSSALNSVPTTAPAPPTVVCATLAGKARRAGWWRAHNNAMGMACATKGSALATQISRALGAAFDGAKTIVPATALATTATVATTH